MYKITFALVALIFASSAVHAQTYNSNSGGWNTGYGTVYGSFGYAMATQNMYNTMQNIMTMTRNCQSLERQFGRAKTLQVNPNCSHYLKSASSGSQAKSSTSAAKPAAAAVEAPPAPKYYGRYRPDPSVNMAVTISNTLFEDPAERAQLKQVIDAVNSAYKKEAAAKGWSNNFASGMTFFIVAMSTVYNDSEVNDETAKLVYDAVNQSIDSAPDFAKASNKDKTTINDMLVGLSALPLATYMEAKQTGNAESLKTARALAGQMIQLVFKSEPEKFKF